jgi:TPR repeat protein
MPKPAGRILWEREIAGADETVADSVTSAQGAALTDPSVLEAQYSAAADEGQVWAQTRLGVLYARAENDPERWQKAVRMLQLAAGQGDAEAQYELAGMAAAGRGMPASDVEAFGYMKEAAERGMADAQYQLAAHVCWRSRHGGGQSGSGGVGAPCGGAKPHSGRVLTRISTYRVRWRRPNEERKSDLVEARVRRQAALFLAAALARGGFKVGQNEGGAESLIKPWQTLATP